LSCSVWAMRGPMPLTNCRDVSRVSSTSEMLSAAPAAATPDAGYLALWAKFGIPRRWTRQCFRSADGNLDPWYPISRNRARQPCGAPQEIGALGRPKVSLRITGRRGSDAVCVSPACRHTGRRRARPFGKPCPACRPGMAYFQISAESKHVKQKQS
jgi:hypothetical protein